jgi:8-oxo-dGTP diphosphatase
LWLDAKGGPLLAVVHRPKQDDWSLPKGKLEDGETFPAAAVREVAEETGVQAELREFAGYALVRTRKRDKLVLFWHMAARGASRFRPSGEVDRLEWLSPREALARLDSEADREVLRGALAARAVSADQPGPARGALDGAPARGAGSPREAPLTAAGARARFSSR